MTQGRPPEQSESSAVTDVLDAAVRTFGVLEGRKDGLGEFPTRGPSRWCLIFDTETTADEVQRIRIGCYQLRYDGELREHGLFYDPAALKKAEQHILAEFAASRQLKLITLQEFIDSVFVRAAYHWQGTTVGFNLPFDLSRIAADIGEARGKMRPGFSLGMAPKGRKGPRIRMKHLSRASRIEFSGIGQRLPRGQRKRQVMAPQRRPAFVDVGTLAAALFSRPFSLGSLARHLNTPSQKLDTDEHGKVLRPDYLDYAVQDVQVTWECFVALSRRYAEHGLSQTPIHRILSEAGIGKGYLREMGVRPWRKVQKNCPPDLVGKIMSTYFGGRTEVHQRRVVMQVLYCDFTSMYPTVSALMGLWPYVIAKGLTSRDATTEARTFLKRVTLADLQRSDAWRQLHVLVLVEPNGDVLPLRAKYRYEPTSAQADRHANYTIGVNHVSAEQPLWYTLADCVASKLLTGRPPKILKAIAFAPGEPQEGLVPVAIAGKAEFAVDPLKDDFFRRIIELRMQTKGPERNALKLVANSTGYGIFVQLDVNERSEPAPVRCYPGTGQPFLADMDKVEEPGEFFHPLLGTLITSAARLMLAIAERLVENAGLTWAFCDTDSMAMARPGGMSEEEFVDKAQAVRSWFQALSPYSLPVDLFKLESANFRLVGKVTDKLEPLYCFAISSKRYVLFNVDAEGRPVIRKASAHGLGHLLPPYGDNEAPPHLAHPVAPLGEIGVTRWQHDFWHCIARAALAGNPDHPDFSALPNFDKPAVSRYAVTTARLWQAFESYNEGRPESAHIRPFNFMLMYQPNQLADWDRWRAQNRLGAESSDEPPRVIGPYDHDLATAAGRCFDRETGKPVPASLLTTRAQALAQYHLRPEAKFLNADYRDRGTVRRRHVQVRSVVYIGKESNRWEEQSYLGIDPQADITYGMAHQDRSAALQTIRAATCAHGLRKLALASGVSRQHLSAILLGKATPTDRMLQKLVGAAAAMDHGERAYDRVTANMREKAAERCSQIGLRAFAASAEIDPGHLSRIITKERRLTPAVLTKLEHGLRQSAYS